MNDQDDRATRRLRVFLRDHRILDAGVRVRRGQSLSDYLAGRTRYLELSDIDWVGMAEQTLHLTLKVDTILWASSDDESLPLAAASAGESRRVEMELESGYLVRARLPLSRDQRVVDYLHGAPAFVPLWDARLMPRGKPLGDVVVNQHAIQNVRDLSAAPSAALGGEARDRARSRSQERVSAPSG